MADTEIAPKPPLADWEKKLIAEAAMLRGYRGRRYLVCRAIDVVDSVILHLGEDDGSDLPPVEGPLPVGPTLMQKRELQNTAANLLRTILLWNDGSVSPQKLSRF